MKGDQFPLDKERLEEHNNEGNDIVLWMSLCKSHLPNQSGQRSTIFESTRWDSLPLPASWQSARHKEVSVRCYNLCIAYNVSHFSGWEPREFTLRLMKTRPRCTYFGLQINDGKVAGFLPSHIETELGRQWKSLEDFVPAASRFKFHIRLAEAKQLPWYIQGFDKHRKALDEEPIAGHAEVEGLEMMLAHSMSCLNLARLRDAEERNDLLMTCLSVLLPIVRYNSCRSLRVDCTDALIFSRLFGIRVSFASTSMCGTLILARQPRSMTQTWKNNKRRRFAFADCAALLLPRVDAEGLNYLPGHWTSGFRAKIDPIHYLTL